MGRISRAELDWIKWHNRELRALVLDGLEIIEILAVPQSHLDKPKIDAWMDAAREQLEGEHREEKKVPEGRT